MPNTTRPDTSSMTMALSRQLPFAPWQIQAVLTLLEEKSTIPFIARYRKPMTGSLDEDQIFAIQTAWKQALALEERRESVLQLLLQKEKLTPALQKQIRQAQSLSQLEDLYRPYKEQRQTKAQMALDNGFGPLADTIAAQKKDPFTLADSQDLEQAGYILAEQICSDPTLRKAARGFVAAHGFLCSKKKDPAQDPQGRYQQYYDFRQPLCDVPGYRLLAMERAEKEGVVTLSIEADWPELEKQALKKIVKNPACASFFQAVLHDGFGRLLLPSVKREIRKETREQAQQQAIEQFGINLEHLLMAPPVKNRRILAWDPGFANGCKLAVLDEYGNLLDTDIVYATIGGVRKEQAKAAVQNLIQKYNVNLVVIGNGTASRESEMCVAQWIQPFPETEYLISSEIGASVYSASAIAKEEFPDLPLEKRSAISIGRRVLDPLSELVKIDPVSLGIGQYQHDVSSKKLAGQLDFVTEKVVNRVGVNVNTASASLLSHVSGLKKVQIAKILASRPFASRSQLLKVLSPKTFEQASGFLRVPGSDNPLDNTGIHPESYGLAASILQTSSLQLQDLFEPAFKKALKTLDAKKLAQQLESDAGTIEDILNELANPGLDPRDTLEAPRFRKDILKLEDLKPGMELTGTVRNVTSFGAFVDIGLHQDGLVHISKMSRQFVKDPSSIVHTGQIVTVYVSGTDPVRQRISLSLLKDAA